MMHRQSRICERGPAGYAPAGFSSLRCLIQIGPPSGQHGSMKLLAAVPAYTVSCHESGAELIGATGAMFTPPGTKRPSEPSPQTLA